MRTLSLIAVVAVVLASCTPSQVDPDAEVAIAGRFVGGDGAPLSEQPVGLHVDPGPSILLWVPAILATLGAACATDLCGADHSTRTDPARHGPGRRAPHGDAPVPLHGPRPSARPPAPSA